MHRLRNFRRSMSRPGTRGLLVWQNISSKALLFTIPIDTTRFAAPVEHLRLVYRAGQGAHSPYEIHNTHVKIRQWWLVAGGTYNTENHFQQQSQLNQCQWRSVAANWHHPVSPIICSIFDAIMVRQITLRLGETIAGPLPDYTYRPPACCVVSRLSDALGKS